MSTITSTSSTTDPSGTPATTSAQGGQMGKDDFLKLFVAQLQHQDPSNPMADGEMMGQMAQFSSLEQMANVAKSNERIAAQLSMQSATSLLGRTVTYLNADGAAQTGVVDKVTTNDGAPKLSIGTVQIDPADVVEVTP